MKIDWVLFRWQIDQLSDHIGHVSKNGDSDTLSALNGIINFLEQYQEDKEDFYCLEDTKIYESEWPLFINFARKYLTDATIIELEPYRYIGDLVDALAELNGATYIERHWNQYLETDEAKQCLDKYIAKRNKE